MCISATTVPELARHEVGVVVHRAKRVRRCHRPTINDSIDQRSMMPTMGWSTIVIRAARTSGDLPLASLEPLFRLPTSASKLDSFSKPQNPPKIVQKAPKTVPKTLPKRLQNSLLSSHARNPQKMQPSYTKTSFWMFNGLQKSSQNRCQKAFQFCAILKTLLETQKIRFSKLKTSQDGPQKFPKFS